MKPHKIKNGKYVHTKLSGSVVAKIAKLADKTGVRKNVIIDKLLTEALEQAR